jgi:site-specific DNA recombinase
LVKQVSRLRITTKVWRSKRGKEHSGNPFKKVTLRRLLTNAIYVGRVEFKGVMYPGEQEGIVEPKIWEEVNADLRSPDRGRERPYQPQSAMLTGILRCGSCQKPMTPTYTAKGVRRYRYYVCRGAIDLGWQTCSTKSISASLIENEVVAQLRTALESSDTRETLKVTPMDWLKFQSGEIDPFVKAIVETVTFDGVRGEVLLNFREFCNKEREAAC